MIQVLRNILSLFVFGKASSAANRRHFKGVEEKWLFTSTTIFVDLRVMVHHTHATHYVKTDAALGNMWVVSNLFHETTIDDLFFNGRLYGNSF